jgi:hypothetical protein
MTLTELGRKVIAAVGVEACEAGYGTSDPRWVGFYALQYGDANFDGTLN